MRVQGHTDRQILSCFSSPQACEFNLYYLTDTVIRLFFSEFLCPAGYSVFLTSLNDDDDGELLDSALKARVSDRMDAGHVILCVSKLCTGLYEMFYTQVSGSRNSPGCQVHT